MDKFIILANGVAGLITITKAVIRFKAQQFERAFDDLITAVLFFTVMILVLHIKKHAFLR